MSSEKHTIEIFTGVEAEVSTYYAPEEKAETGPEAQYPGCDEEFYVEEVFINGEEIAEYLTSDFLEKIIQMIIDAAPEPDMSKRRRSLWYE